jgi:hypothetical protein
MIALSPEQRAEMLRKAVLEYLAPRQALRFDPDVLRQRLASAQALDFNPSADEVAAALTFLRGRGWVDSLASGFGATRFYQATSAGVLAIEQGALEPHQP